MYVYMYMYILFFVRIARVTESVSFVSVQALAVTRVRD